MNPKTKFKKFYYKLPEKARTELVYGFPEHPMTLNVVWFEIRNDTKFGKQILNKMGFDEDD